VCVGGVTDLTLFVENANAPDAGLATDGVDDVKNFLALVAEHRVAQAAADQVTDMIRILQDHLLRLTPIGTKI
jgi:hypothetical protein